MLSSTWWERHLLTVSLESHLKTSHYSILWCLPSLVGCSWHTFQEPSLIIFSMVAHGGPFWIGLMLSGITLGAKLFLCFCFFHFFEPMVWRASTMHPSLLWTMKMQKPVSGTLPLPKKQENTLLFKKSIFSLNQKIKVLRLVQWCLCFSLPYFGHVPGYWASLLLEAISYFKRLRYNFWAICVHYVPFLTHFAWSKEAA